MKAALGLSRDALASTEALLHDVCAAALTAQAYQQRVSALEGMLAEATRELEQYRRRASLERDSSEDNRSD